MSLIDFNLDVILGIKAAQLLSHSGSVLCLAVVNYFL